jgi:proteasome lid subunit RPN8/RPN11
MSRIKLSDLIPIQYAEQPMPLDGSLKWISQYEDQVKLHPLVFFTQLAYRKCVDHVTSDMEREVGGVLVGEVRTDAARSQTYVMIENIIPASFTSSGETHVTFTQNSLVDLNNQMENSFPGKTIVGWYHTHPRLGVFMSNHDTFLHRHFFPEPTHVALVIDPYYNRAGFFCWQNGNTLDPIKYVGFYETSDVDDVSIVEWENLEPVIVVANGSAKGESK